MSQHNNSGLPPVIVVDSGLDIDRPYWVEYKALPVDKDGKYYPIFTRSEVAKTFFGWTSFWLRSKMKEVTGPDGRIALDGGWMPALGVDGYGSPVFSLADIERVAHALAQAGLMPGIHLQRTVAVVRAVAQQYGVPL